ncbi:MAG: hypothetical protein KJ899_15200 [Gammaproteobacteria bacterium]|nr:hypothetical protein [Gammaproteobacteria bacterium]
MPFRKIKQKKYNGINEYFRKSDHDKKTVSFYITFRDIDNKVKREKTDATNKDEALEQLNQKKIQLSRDRKEIQKDSSILHKKY